MRAVDTNVLVRALVQDDAAQAHRAADVLGAGPFYIPITVILELEWVLRSRHGYPGRLIADAMEKLAKLENAIVGEQAAVVAAAAKLRRGWDFADALHHSLSAGCDDFVTFDADLARRARRADSSVPPVVAI